MLQPSSEMVYKFDRMILMSEKKIIYNGKASKAKGMFAAAGYSVPRLCNPAEHYMNMLTAQYPTEENTEDFF
jgi:hypothetical protein